MTVLDISGARPTVSESAQLSTPLGKPGRALDLGADDVAGLGERELCLLSIVALESTLSESRIDRLEPGSEFVATKLAQGWLVRTTPLVPGGPRELAVAPQIRQLVLRRAVRTGTLDAALELQQARLGPSSRAQLQKRLLTGKLVPNADSGARDHWLSRQLRLSLTAPFDPVWLNDVWGARALSVALSVLEDAQVGMAPCPQLYEWCSLQEPNGSDAARAARVLSVHATLCGHPDSAQRFAADAPANHRMAIGAIGALFSENLGSARLLAQRACSFQGKSAADFGVLTPLLLLLLLSGDDDQQQVFAQRVRAGRAKEPLRSELKLLRQLAKHRQDPDPTSPRVTLPQNPEASAGEWLLGGLLVHAFVSHVWTRQAWGEALHERGCFWVECGYRWMGRQALLVAEQLHEVTRSRLKEDPRILADELEQPGTALVDLPLAVPAWRRELAGLVSFDKQPMLPAHRQRVVWYVDVVHGSLTHPVLERYDAKRGYVEQGRYAPLELPQHATDVPPEDARVLDILRRSTQPLVESLEALVGHPRVRSGIRNQQAVEVTLGRYFVSTEEDGDSISLHVKPSGLTAGLNVLRVEDNRLELVRVPEEVGPLLESLRGGLSIPRAHQAEALAALETLSTKLPVESPLLRVQATEAADSTPCLRLSKCAGAVLVELGVRPFGEGGRFFPAGKGAVPLLGRREGRRLRVERDLSLEEGRCQKVLLQLPFLNEERRTEPNQDSFILSEEATLELLSNLTAQSLDCALEWNQCPPYRLTGRASVAGLKVTVRPERGWYLVAGEVAIDEVTALTLAELSVLPAFARGRFVRLPSGEFIEFAPDLRRLLGALSQGSLADSGRAIRLSPAQVLGLTIEGTPSWLQLPAQAEQLLSSLSQQASPAVPKSLRAELRPYQIQGFAWLTKMASLSLGVCLADDMGLGKTVQILALLLTRPQGSRHLIVAPTSVCSNWARECARFAPGLQVLEWEARTSRPLGEEELTNDSHALVVIVSYAQLARSQEQFQAVSWDTIALDEAQFIKNARAERSLACHALSGSFRIAATGTPIENHLGDLWSLFHFLNPGLLGTHRHFTTFFQKPIEREHDAEARTQLTRVIRPFVLRRTKEQVLPNLPPVSHVRQEIRLSPEEAQRYALLRREIRERIKAKTRNNKLEILAEITRLRRFCCHPRLVFPTAALESSKLEHLLDLATELSETEHSALIFSQYTDFLEMARERFSEAGLLYETLDGSTPKAERQRRIDRFQSGEVSFFLISLKAGGFGINLTAADYVIHTDPWWNPAAMAQATDRAHRIGQERPVVVVEFVTKSTIEEDIFGLHQRKRELASSTLNSEVSSAEFDNVELSAWLKDALSEREFG